MVLSSSSTRGDGADAPSWGSAQSTAEATAKM
jgi:hypothetical protein